MLSKSKTDLMGTLIFLFLRNRGYHFRLGCYEAGFPFAQEPEAALVLLSGKLGSTIFIRLVPNQ
jgi:hypothetical protein